MTYICVCICILVFLMCRIYACAVPDIMVESFRESVHIEEQDILVEITFKVMFL